MSSTSPTPSSSLAPGLLRDQHILVTGGGTGLGAGMAHHFAQLGAAITVCGRRRAPLEERAAELRALGVAAEGIACDLRKADKVDAMVAEAEQRSGPLTGLVNNAAGNFLAFSETISSRGFDAIVDTNLKGGFHATQAVGKRWIEREQAGAVVSIVTTYAEHGGAYVLPSAMSKAGMSALTRALAVEWGPLGIRLNAIAPGPIPTKGAWDRLMPDANFEEQMRAGVPLRRFASKTELADLAAFLLSPNSLTLTGQIIELDGGARVAGGASFNELTRLPREQLGKLFSALRPRPAGGERGESNGG
ncbi:MAG: 2,4-dienoyl-CoA reductase [Planctomycetota bacterium]|nr:MAG: 2,4-dienoyl-CoA reductase [Planctomycetota bacterium]